MQRHWHIICTKEKQEKKVTAALAKKGVESYCPFTKKEIKNGTRTSMEYAPVFNSYVFAYISVIEIDAIKRIPNIISLAHWQSKPVVLNNDEVDTIRKISENYTNIQIEKSNLYMDDEFLYTPINSTAKVDNFTSGKSGSLKVVFPTLGYTMIADRNLTTSNTLLSTRKFSLASLFF